MAYFFLFTDIEQSTRTWERDPERMTHSLAIHDDIVASAIEGAGGTVVKGTGDGFMAVFGDPEQAVGAAADMTRRLVDAEWGDGPVLRIRVGIHAGDADVRGDDYFGTAVNRAARLMGVASGGQVVLSGDVAGHLDGRPIGDLGVRDLGEHRLKDLAGPQRIYQLTGPGLETSFPPLGTLDLTPNNLPEQLSDMVGRERELADIRSLLDAGGSRLVTLLGPGGTGKTRLALAAAADQIDRFGDGVFFVDLEDVVHLDGVLPAIARVVGTGAYGDESPIDLAVNAIGDRRVLIVLDNFEQVVEAAPQIAAVLQRCPGLTCIVTTREALRVRGEHVFAVEPLALPPVISEPSADEAGAFEGVALFVERARAGSPSFDLTDDNVSEVVAICRRLDGLPLALELAAARLRLFDAAELLERLEDRLDVLKGGRDLPERQRALETTVAWSYDLLGPTRQQMLRLLSAFSGASVEAIETVATGLFSDQVDVIDDLQSLVDKSLVRPERTVAGTRYTMLETIRDFARNELDRSHEEAAAVRRSHAEYYADLSTELRDELRGDARGAVLDQAAVGLGNLRTSWAYWVDEQDVARLEELLETLWALHDAQGHYHGALELASDLLAILDMSPEAEDRARAAAMQVSVARATMAIHGYTSEVEAAFTRAIELQGESGAQARFPVLRSLATLYVLRYEPDKALEVGNQLMAIAERDRDPDHLIDAHLVVGSNLGFTYEMDAGLDHLEKAIELYRPGRTVAEGLRLGPHPAVVSMTTSAFFLWWMGFPDRAAVRAEQAIAAARTTGHAYSLAYAIYHVAFLETWNLRIERLPELAEELGVLARRHDFLIWEALSIVLDGLVMIVGGESKAGLDTIERGIQLYESASAPPAFWSSILLLRANACLLGGEIDDARRFAEEAADVIGGDDGQFAPIAVALGDITRAEGDPHGALEWYDRATECARAVSLAMPEVMSRSRAAELDRSDERLAALEQLLGTFTEGAENRLLMQARAVVAGEPTGP